MFINHFNVTKVTKHSSEQVYQWPHSPRWPRVDSCLWFHLHKLVFTNLVLQTYFYHSQPLILDGTHLIFLTWFEREKPDLSLYAKQGSIWYHFYNVLINNISINCSGHKNPTPTHVVTCMFAVLEGRRTSGVLKNLLQRGVDNNTGYRLYNKQVGWYPAGRLCWSVCLKVWRFWSMWQNDVNDKWDIKNMVEHQVVIYDVCHAEDALCHIVLRII